MKIIIVGNQNSGKSALYNALTGGVVPVGNRAGVTVDAQERAIKKSKHTLIDLPGTYSLTPFTEEEKITCEYVRSKKYDLILVPGDSFKAKGFFRMAYCIDTEKVKRSLPVLEKFVKEEYGR